MGARPKFKATSSPPEEIQIMMKECWNSRAKSRPTAQELKQKLNDIVTAFRELEIRERPQTDRQITLYQRWKHVDFGWRRLSAINNIKNVQQKHAEN